MASATSASQLTGRVAIVTGGTHGLGETIATLFVERGAQGLVICGRNTENGICSWSASARALFIDILLSCSEPLAKRRVLETGHCLLRCIQKMTRMVWYGDRLSR